MKTLRKMSVGFYEIVGADDLDWRDLLREERQRDATDRLRKINGNKYRVETVTDLGGVGGQKLIACDLLRIRDEEQPGRVLLDQDGEQDLDLKDNEFLSEGTAWLIDPHRRYLALQTNIHGARQGVVAKFLSDLAARASVDLKPLLQLNAYERALSAGSVRKLQMELAQVDGKVLKNLDISGIDMVQLLHASHAPLIEITIKMGHHDGSLETGFVRKILKKLRNEPEESVRKLKVQTGGDEVHSIIDLLKDRLTAEEFFEWDGRRVTPSKRFDVLGSAWRACEEDLQKLRS